MILTNDDESLH